MERRNLLRLWDESWTQGIWIAPWSKALKGLTPRQAARAPAAGRHCIWQIVNHVCIWREYTLAKLDGRPGPSLEQVLAANFEVPARPSPEAWRRTLRRLRKTHDDVRAAIATPRSSLKRLRYHLGHDAYHLGQIMYVRALLGMKPIE